MMNIKSYTAPTKKCSFCNKDIYIRKKEGRNFILEESGNVEGLTKELVLHDCKSYKRSA